MYISDYAHMIICAQINLNKCKKGLQKIMGRISIDLPDELEKKLRLKTVERFGGKKGDLSRAVEDAVKTWVTKE
jgi:hypothetical protein